MIPVTTEQKNVAPWQRELRSAVRDPLSLNDRILAGLVERIEAIRHVDTLRLHTRLPVVLPSRIDQAPF